MALTLLTKRRIADIFKRYAPRLDPWPYFVASQVFPMLVNPHALDNPTDWFVILHLFLLLKPLEEYISISN